MAADDRLERAMSDRLHAWLDPAAGPHPRWSDSPAALAVAGDGAVRLPTRRVPRLGLLMAAAVALALLVAGLILAGGRTETHPPSITPDRGLVAPPSAEATDDNVAPSSIVGRGRARPHPAPPPRRARPAGRIAGTVDPRGQVDGIRTVELNGWDGHVIMSRSCTRSTPSSGSPSLLPRPPFVTDSGQTVHVRGTAFFRLTLRGLTRQTWLAHGHDRRRGPCLRFTPHGGAPDRRDAAAFACRANALPNDGPGRDSTETWIIGLEQPACLDVHVMSLAGYSDDSRDNTIVVPFGPVPSPSG